MQFRSRSAKRFPTFFHSLIVVSSTLALLLSACATAKEHDLPLSQPNLESAWVALWKNEFRSAESSFRDALESSPSSQEARRGLALVLFARGSGKESFDTLVALDREDADSLFAASVRAFARETMPSSQSAARKASGLALARAKSEKAAIEERDSLAYLADYFRYRDPNIEKSKDAARRLGALVSWKILGPFPDVSDSGWAKEFIDEAAADGTETTSYSGASGRQVSWVSPDIIAPDAVLRPGAYLGYDDFGSVFYALAAFSVKKAGEYRLFVERRGKIAIRIDGTVVMADPIERSGGEYRGGRIRLEAGDHRILAKLAAEDAMAPSLRVSLVPVSGIDDLETAAEAILSSMPGYASGDSNESLAVLLAARAALPGVEDDFWRANILLESGYAEAALAEIGKARAAGAQCSALFDYLESRCLSALGRNDAARNALLRSRAQETLFAPAIGFLLSECLAERRYGEAHALLRNSASLTDWPGLASYELALALTESRDIYAKAEAFDKRWPDYPDAALLLAHLGGAFGYNLRDQAEAIQKKGSPAAAEGLLLDWAFERRQFSEAATRAEARLPFFPDDARLRYIRAQSRYLSGMSNFDASLAALEKLCTIFAGSRELMDLQASLESMKVVSLQKEVAQAPKGDAKKEEDLKAEREKLASARKAVIALSPRDYAARTDYRNALRLSDLDMDLNATSIASAIAAYEDARRAKATASDDAEIVLDESSIVFFGDGASRTFDLVIIKALSKAGVARESSQELRYGDNTDVSQAFVLKPDGDRIEARVGNRGVSFPGLEVGDYLVLRYTTNGYHGESLDSVYWDSEMIQHYYTCFRRSLRFIYPQGKAPAIRIHNAEGLGIEQKKGSYEAGMSQVSITASELPGLRLGRHMSDLRDVGAWVDISSAPDWQAIADWYRDLYRGRVEPSYEIREKAASLVSGIVSEGAKVEKLYDFVANGIDYADLAFQYSALVPKRPRRVLSDGFGDCKDKSALLIALLAAEGISSHIALSAPDYRGPNPFLPSPRFSHAIVVVPRPEGDLILDPTANDLTYPALPAALPGTWLLPIPPAGIAADLARIPVPEPKGCTLVFLEIAVGAGGSAVKGTATFRGDLAYPFREALSSAREDLRSDALSGFMNRELPGLSLGEWKAAGLEGAGRGLEPSLDFSARLPALAVQGRAAPLALPWAARLPAALLEPRSSAQGPLTFDFREFQTPLRQTVVAGLPPGFEPFGIPKDARYEFGAAYASFHFSVSGSNIVCERELYLPALTVAETDKAAFADFVTEVAVKSSEQILLAVPIGAK
jgi:hypothetical protein